MKLKINKELLPLKGHYLFFNAGTAPLYPTMPVYAKQLGFSSVVVGTIYTVFPICGVFAKPVIGALGDMLKAHKTLLLICELLIMTAYFGIQFVPGVPQGPNGPSLTVSCSHNSSFTLCPRGARDRGMAAQMVAGKTVTECFMHCDHPAHLTPDNCDLCTHSYFRPYENRAFNDTKNNPNNKKSVLNSGNHWSDPIRHPNDVVQLSDSEAREVRELHSERSHSKHHTSRFTAVIPLQHAYLEDSCFTIPIAKTNDTPWPRCLEPSLMNCYSTCTLRPLQRLLQASHNSDLQVTSYWQFWLFFVLLFVSWVFTTVSVSLTDTVCVEVLGRQSRSFGNQRLFGSAGWGVMAVASGFLVDAYSDGTDVKNYTPAFYLMLGPMLLDILSTYFLKYEQTTVRSRNIFKDVGHLFLDIRIVVFMIWCTFIGVCFGMIWNFLFWYIEELADLQGGNAQANIKTIEGLVGGVQCFLGEVPSYFFSGWLLQRIGHGYAMSLVTFVAGLRFLLYSVITDPWWVLPVSVLQAMNGLFFPTMTSYAKIVAEPGTEATVQGLVSALCEGVGVALGSFMGGLLVDWYGGAATFRIFGIAAMVMTVFNVSAQCLLDHYCPKKDKTEEQSEKIKLPISST